MKQSINYLKNASKAITLMLITGWAIGACSTEEDPIPEPTSSFTFVVSGMNVSFSNTSEDAQNYQWNFGDGTSSLEQNPSKTYSENGEYSVELTSIGKGGTQSSTQKVTIDVTPEPVSAFNFDVDDYNVTFTNESTNAISYSWDFGDGTTSLEQNPSKTYSENGEYSVELTSIGEGGTQSSTQKVTIDVTPDVPTSSFDYTVDDFTVTFANSSTNATTYAWDFGDGATSVEDNPVRTYVENGTYTVELTSSGEGGSVKSSKSIEIDVAPTPVANFSFTVNDYEVTFTNESTDAITYSWDFGDGSSSTNTNPTKEYAEYGSYQVVLSAIGEEETVTSTQEVTIAVSIPLPESFINDFYTLAGSSYYVLSSDATGDYIKIGGDKYYYDDTRDVSFSSVIVTGFGTYDVYEVKGKTSSNISQTFWIYQEGSALKDTNKLYVSLSAEDSGYTIYAHVGGRTVTKAIYNNDRGSFVYNYGFAEWCEYQSDGGTYCEFTVVSTDDWSVVLRKENGDTVVLNTNTMKVQFEPVGGTMHDLYEIIELSR